MDFQQQDIRTELPSGSFHLILCRNLVLTYFEASLQRQVLDQISQRLYDGGVLVIGRHEQLPAGVAGLQPWLPQFGIYHRSDKMDQNFKPYIENAIRWAKEQLDSEAYSFRCLAFVEDAYEIGNGIEIFGGSSAKESAEEYGTQTTPLIPPRGTFVFYDCFGPLFETYQNWGHVGLSLGDGQVIHVWNKVRMDHYLAVEQLAAAPSWTQPRYLGWTPVARILQGYRDAKQR